MELPTTVVRTMWNYDLSVYLTIIIGMGALGQSVGLPTFGLQPTCGHRPGLTPFNIPPLHGRTRPIIK